MTDETQTLTREVARCADLLARILDATTPARLSTPSPSGTLTRPPATSDDEERTDHAWCDCSPVPAFAEPLAQWEIDLLAGPLAPNDGEANTRGVANALGENAQAPQENAVPAASRPHTPGSGTCEGRAVKPPQNATQGVWPTVPGWYWVRGVDRSEADPVEGIADFDGSRWFRSTHADGNTWSIYRDVSGDRLDEAVPVTPVPTWLIETLIGHGGYAPRGLEGLIDDIRDWLENHKEARR